MKRIFAVFIIILSLFFSGLKSHAAVGCRFSGQVYINQDFFFGFPLNTWNTPLTESCSIGATTAYAKFISNTTMPASTCGIGFLGFGGTGVLVNYDVLFCPLDDYLPALLIVSSIFSVFLMRRNLLINNSNLNG